LVKFIEIAHSLMFAAPAGGERNQVNPEL